MCTRIPRSQLGRIEYRYNIQPLRSSTGPGRTRRRCAASSTSRTSREPSFRTERNRRGEEAERGEGARGGGRGARVGAGAAETEGEGEGGAEGEGVEAAKCSSYNSRRKSRRRHGSYVRCGSCGARRLPSTGSLQAYTCRRCRRGHMHKSTLGSRPRQSIADSRFPGRGSLWRCARRGGRTMGRRREGREGRERRPWPAEKLLFFLVFLCYPATKFVEQQRKSGNTPSQKSNCVVSPPFRPKFRPSHGCSRGSPLDGYPWVSSSATLLSHYSGTKWW